jgi:hypothetical protein
LRPERSGRRLQDHGARHCRGVVRNQPGDTESKQRTRALRLVHRPGHDEFRNLAEGGNGLSIDQPLVNRDTLEPPICEATKHCPELSCVANGMNAAHGCSCEGLEQSPRARAHGKTSLAQVWLDRTEDMLGKSLPRPLQVEHELSLGGHGREQLLQAQLPAPRRLELPSIPKNGDRPGRLQVPDLQPAPIEADVSFYKGRLEELCGVEIGETIPGAVRDEERAPPVLAEARQGRLAHRARV